MTRVTCDITVSTDGFAAGPNQSLATPLGEGGERLHRWMFEQPDENAAEVAAILDAGAYIMGRNMFGPGRGDWDADWTGWWGDDPPYHAAVFVLTHYPREPLPMAGGTTFHFVTDGIHFALEQARAAAGQKSVAIAGGASTVRQYLSAGLIDELRLHIAPIELGAGEPVLPGLPNLNLKQVGSRQNDLVTHVTYRHTT
ncbi:dihydrofolate reductase family protein [Cryobacterium arcticum]|uniref:5-amino-6-(5-phosphoribosylamino)uracil reductase n=1 Tax=Cryobacterium arcticum TaxID=670052 RepID=A0A317ZP23_9MICO|nr:dihydrofolate reductase family protein [Cryobacterium arcticum]PXA68231.1 5-amino-6-(5-phosphoribosylamino)uracil reductase [Cryobacterium arcticum]